VERPAGDLGGRPSRRTWRKLARHPSALIGVAVLGIYASAAVLGPLVITFDPAHNELIHNFEPPSPQHVLGTDDLGRDELSMLIFGARYTLALGFLAVAVGLAVGVPIGAVSGYVGGRVDLVLSRRRSRSGRCSRWR